MTYYLCNDSIFRTRFPYVIFDSTNNRITRVFNLDCIYPSDCIYNNCSHVINEDKTLNYYPRVLVKFSSLSEFIYRYKLSEDYLEFGTMEELIDYLDSLKIIEELKK